MDEDLINVFNIDLKKINTMKELNELIIDKMYKPNGIEVDIKGEVSPELELYNPMLWNHIQNDLKNLKYKCKFCIENNSKKLLAKYLNQQLQTHIQLISYINFYK